MPQTHRHGSITRRPASALQAMADGELDVLVIGGGVTGAGAALDAVTRGLRVGLVEARDYASGTSSRSSKLIHGGLRYLEQLNFGLVREALRERSLILNHLAPAPGPARCRSSTRCSTGCGSGSTSAAACCSTTPWAGRHGVPDPPAPDAQAGAARVLLAAQGRPGRGDPVLRRPGRRRAAHDDDRAHRRRSTAPCAPPAPGSSTSCARATGSSERVVRDLETGTEHEIRARQTINAAGVWTDEIQEMVGGRGQFNVRASKGVHILVPRDRIHANDRDHQPHREERAVHHPVGRALDHRHHRHRLEPRPRPPGRQPDRHRLPARARQPRCWPPR